MKTIIVGVPKYVRSKCDLNLASENFSKFDISRTVQPIELKILQGVETRIAYKWSRLEDAILETL
jgi:hypothetical protein